MSKDNHALEAKKNRLLTALPDHEYERLIPHLEPVELTFEKVLIEPEEPITEVYFPRMAVVSLITTMENGSSVEVGIVSNEGMVGIPIILGGNQSTTKAIVQVPDGGLQMKADVLKSEFDRGGESCKIFYFAISKLYIPKFHKVLLAIVSIAWNSASLVGY